MWMAGGLSRAGVVVPAVRCVLTGWSDGQGAEFG